MIRSIGQVNDSICLIGGFVAIGFDLLLGRFHSCSTLSFDHRQPLDREQPNISVIEEQIEWLTVNAYCIAGRRKYYCKASFLESDLRRFSYRQKFDVCVHVLEVTDGSMVH